MKHVILKLASIVTCKLVATAESNYSCIVCHVKVIVILLEPETFPCSKINYATVTPFPFICLSYKIWLEIHFGTMFNIVANRLSERSKSTNAYTCPHLYSYLSTYKILGLLLMSSLTKKTIWSNLCLGELFATRICNIGSWES